ncbi:MAG TPA: helix-turn-helix domain-containing protein [Dokdonella sp.]
MTTSSGAEPRAGAARRSTRARAAANGASSEAFEASALETLGLDESEQAVYRKLFERETAGATAVAAALRRPAATVQRALDSLERKGLVTRLPERPPRYLLAPPDIAIEALVSKRQGELQRARLVGAHLQEKLMRGRGGDEKDERRVVEIITGSEAQVRVYEQLQHSARTEFLGIERPPYVMGVANRNAAQGRAIARGVAYRNIVDASTLELPGALDRLRDHIGAGEETRVFAGVSLKLVVVDRSLALVPLDLDRVYDAALLVRSSTLLDALCQRFELMWARAAPIVFEADGRATVGAPAPLPPGADRLVAMLAAGLNDKAIAHDLAISARTLDRRVVELMRCLDARTRFQAGWLAALRAQR